MISCWKFKFVFAAILFLGVSQIGNASPILCSSLTQTLAGYAGQTCAVGNLIFNFPTGTSLYSYSNDPDNPNVPPNDVNVTIVGDGLTPNAQVGFTFSTNVATPWIATNPDASLFGDSNNEADISLSFSASVNAPLGLTTTTLIVNPSIDYYGCATNSTAIENCANYGGGDFIGAGETVTDNNGPPNNTGLGSINTTVVGNTSADSVNNSGTPLGDTDFFPYVPTSINIEKDVLIAALDTNSSVEVDSLTETFTYTDTPEPGPFLITGAGLGLLFLLRRRKAVLGLLGAVVLVAVSSNSANASPLCTTLSGDSLAQYEAAGTCTIGNVLFTFNTGSLVINSASGTTRQPVATGITVNVSGLGFQFLANNPVPQTLGTGKLSFTVDFTAESTGEINGLFAADTITQNGNGTFAAGSTCPSTNSCAQLLEGATDLAFVDFPGKSGGGGQSAIAALAPDTTVTVSTTFDMSSSGGNAATNYTHLSIFDAGVTEVPEPLGSLMLGSGLVALGLLGRRRLRRS